MARELRTNTAIIVTVGPFLSITDGVTLQTSLTITNEKVSFVVDLDDGNAPTLVLDNITGAASGTANDLNYITNCDAALMQIELAAANVNYLGRARLTITDAAHHMPVWEDFEIVSQQYYDAKYGTGNFYADLRAMIGSAISETSAGYLAAGLKKLLDIANPVFTLASVNQTGDAYAKVDTEIATMQGNVTDILADTNELQGELVDGGRTDLLIDDIVSKTTAIKAKTDMQPSVWYSP